MWIKFSQSVPESADSTSGSTLDLQQWAERLEQCAWWRGKPSQSRSWLKRLKKGGWMTRLSGSEICATYPLTNCRTSTGIQGATPASPSARQGNGWEKTTRVICGPSYSDSSNLFGLAESSSRTSVGICHSALIESFKTWRDAVSAVRSDSLRRRKLALRTEESGSSFWAWPTPCTMNRKSRKAMTASTSNARRSGGGNSSTPGLEHAVEMSEGTLPKELDGMTPDQVGPATRRMWPTPTVMHVKRGNHDEDLDNFQRRVQNYKDGKTKGAPGKSLGVAVRMWPTPTQQNDPRHTTKTGVSHSGTSLIDAVRLWPTPLVSTGGPHEPDKAGPNLAGAVKTERMQRNGLLNSDSNSTVTSDGATPSGSASRSATDATLWPTPSANEDAAGKPGGKMQKMLGNHPGVRGPLDQEKSSTRGSHPVLSPLWVEPLMGLPLGWTDAGEGTGSID